MAGSYADRLRRAFEDLGRDDDASGSVFDAAVGAFGDSVARWAEGGSLRRFLGDLDRDILIGRNECFEVSAQLTGGARIGERARFFMSGEEVGEADIRPDGGVGLVTNLAQTGTYHVELEVLSSSGTVVAPRGATGRRCVQVVDAEPVALVDAAGVLDGSVSSDVVRHLQDEGFVVAYFDIDEKNRHELIRTALVERSLPTAAVLAYAAEDQGLETFGIDFTELFAVTALRRLRASGVLATLLVTNAEVDESRAENAKLFVRRPHAVDEVADAKTAAAELHAARAAAAPCDWRLDEMTASERIDGNRFVVELDNHAARERLFEVIEGARSSIHVQLYILSEGRFSEHLIVRLIERARAGVDVRLMVDALYSGHDVLGINNPLVVALRNEPRADVLAITPIGSTREISASKLKRRDHRKLVVVDGTRAFVTGRNGSDEYYFGFDETPVHDQTPHDRIPWLDAHVEVEGPLVTRIQQTFVDTWREQDGPTIPDDVVVDVPRAGDATGRLVVHRGLADANGLALYETMFDIAEDHVFVVNDFPVAAPIEQAVRRAIARGVKVRFLTGNAVARRADGTFFEGPLYRELFEYMVKRRLEPLMAAGVEVFEYVPPPSPIVVARGGKIRPYVHAKVVSVDGRFASVGSANLDVTASFWEDEANVVVQDPAFCGDLEAKLAAMIEGSLPVGEDTDYWARERTHRAVIDRLWPGSLYS